jgi:putative nucleotidyltransferase with HDIG domain
MMHVARKNSPIQIERTFEMPSIPVVLTKIIQVLDDDSASGQQLEQLILHDPSLTARILKLANSAFYSFRTEVKTLSHAIALLGIGLVKSLAIGVSIFESFTKGSKHEAALINKLWMHSFGVGLISQEIWTRRARMRKEIEFAFLCGLLHDLGKVVLFKKSPLHYGSIFARGIKDNEHDLMKLEAESYGVDHADVGSALAKQWGFPPDLVTIIKKHHAAIEAKEPLVTAVSLADNFAKEGAIGFDGDNRLCAEFPKLLAQLGVDHDEHERIQAFAGRKRQEIEKFFELTS